MPYGKDFLFVDGFEHISEQGAKGYYTYKKDEYFYKAHFPHQAVTPGVIMIETMAQIGLVGLGMYLTEAHLTGIHKDFVLVATDVIFSKKVFPEETVFVTSEKLYFRFGKLKCKVIMTNTKDEIVCSGTLSGVVLS